MTSHLDSQTTTDIKPKILFGVQCQNVNPHDKHNICGTGHAGTNRKDDIFMQRGLVQSFTYILEWGNELVHQQSTHGAGYIPLCSFS